MNLGRLSSRCFGLCYRFVLVTESIDKIEIVYYFL
jgi:hypothetical protein